jgi:hypothetical protein
MDGVEILAALLEKFVFTHHTRVVEKQRQDVNVVVDRNASGFIALQVVVGKIF